MTPGVRAKIKRRGAAEPKTFCRFEEALASPDSRPGLDRGGAGSDVQLQRRIWTSIRRRDPRDQLEADTWSRNDTNFTVPSPFRYNQFGGILTGPLLFTLDPLQPES
jgi:hypothetical protein